VRKKKYLFLAIMILTGIITIQIAADDMHAEENPIPESHPIELLSSPICTECHVDESGVALKPIKTFNHSSDFIKRHRFYASQTDHLCRACHKTSFCTDCHAYKDELKPSLKYSDEPERWLPHRGDYLFQHRIDGRMDPASCFRCHGRQNNRRCKECHK